jgi:hypothetical protein
MSNLDIAPRQLIEKPKSYEEMLELPGFQEVLDDKQHQLRDVLSDYDFEKSCPCGLRSCRTAHNMGYLVETTDGLKTNVGNKCGKNAFGENFLIKANENKKLRERQDLLARVSEILQSAPVINQRIKTLTNASHGIRWIKQLKTRLADVIGADLVQDLLYAQRRGDLSVSEARERSAAEIEMIAAVTRKPKEQLRFETVSMGRLKNLEWLDYDFRARLAKGIMVPLDELKDIEAAALRTPRLRELIKPFELWERTLDEAERAANTAEAFLDTENLKLLTLWIPDRLSSKRRALLGWIDSKPYNALKNGLPI